MVAQRLRIALDTALAGSKIGHVAGRRHVASLAAQASRPGRALAPFRVSRVHRDAKDRPLVAGSAIAAVAIEGRVNVFAALDISKGAEEALILYRPGKHQAKAAMGQAELVTGDAGD